jgi:hypothetical protein
VSRIDQIGSERRGHVTFTADDVRDGHLEVSLTLGV